jgi:hypothetical protein
MNNPVDYIVYEGTMSRMERTIRRLWVLAIILIVLLVGSNGMWLWYESQFQYFTVTQENDGGLNNYIGNDGDITNGTTDDKW